jgi:N-acetylglucosamine kinase-like BadF-type ATPase
MESDDRPQRRGYLGVDMGGSTTRAHLSAGAAIRDWQTTGGNLALDRDAARDILIGLIADAQPLAACIGIAGARTAPDSVTWLAAQLAPLGCPVSLLTDAELAVHAAFGPSGDGIVVCAGTGSVAIVRCDGAVHLIGGHGYLFGDAGSAYDIGRRIIATALRERDVHPETSLADDLQTALGEPLDAVVARVYASPGERGPVALLAERVSGMRSTAARAVLDEAAAALVDLVTTAQRRFGPLPVRTLGGVFSDPVIAQTLRLLCEAIPAPRRPEVAAADLAEAGTS